MLRLLIYSYMENNMFGLTLGHGLLAFTLVELAAITMIVLNIIKLNK